MSESLVRTTGENRALNLIRAIAALLVVLGHVRLLFFQDQASRSVPTGLFYLVTSLGTPAVIVFFVLSGYWVGGQVVRSIERRRFTWQGYAASRLTRLWIVLIPALVITFVLDTVGRAVAPHADIYARTTLYDGVPPGFDHSASSLLGTAVFVGDLHVQVFGSDMPLWSLAYEFWYYAMFPAALLVLGLGRSTRNRLIAVPVLVLSVIVAGVPVLLLFPAWLAGAVVAWRKDALALQLLRLPRAAVILLQTGLTAAAVLLVVATRQGTLNSTGGKLLLALVTAAWIASLVDDVRWPGRADRVLGALSRSAHWSYSLYAVHMPIVVLGAAVIVPRRVDRWTLSPASLAAFVVIVVLLEGVAFIFAAATEQRTGQVRRLLAGGELGRGHRVKEQRSG